MFRADRFLCVCVWMVAWSLVALDLAPAAEFRSDDALSEARPADEALVNPPPAETANPYLAFLPTGARPDMRHWRRVMARAAAERADAMAPVERGASVPEAEPNDSAATAQTLAGFGTGIGEASALDVVGTFASAPAPVPIGPFAEDDGSISLASDTGLVAGGSVVLDGVIGDGPYGSAGSGSGDFDVFRVAGVARGQMLVIDIDTPLPMEALDTFVALYNAAGEIVRLNEDGDSAVSFDSLLAVPAPSDGDYYVAVAGSLFPFAALLGDPFDPASGPGVGSEGDYTLTLRLDAGDPDWFSVELEACDILGLQLLGPAGDEPGEVLVERPNGGLAVASTQDLSGAYAVGSPLPGGEGVVAAFVAEAPGTYRLRALGLDGAYTLALRVFRPVGESDAEPKTLFVDFDGATLDTGIFVGAQPGMATLSPLASFLSNWGFTPGDEDALIDAVLAVLRENVVDDPAGRGPSPRFGVRLLNSRDHADPFGQPGVSRLIVGGSIAELGIPTIGIAQSIDVGNFGGEETAVVLLDLLSQPAPSVDSLNTFPLAAGTSRLEFVGLALGNIAAHEAGHFTGSFHTENRNVPAALMDRGGNLPNTLGVGDDGVFGTNDDLDIDFEVDLYVDAEGFAGFEDTLAVQSCGCAFDAGLVFADSFERGALDTWSTTVD